jgi:hypothetical protein
MEMESPKIDTRDIDDLEKEIKQLISRYVPEWKPGEGDVGQAFIKIFSHMAQEIIDRLNQTPTKYFGAFLEMLGVSLQPASAAKAPVTFYLSEGADSHVMIPKATPAACGDIVFETRENMLATPAKLIKAFAVDPRNNGIFQLPAALIQRKKETGSISNGFNIFEGENLLDKFTHPMEETQRTLYLGFDQKIQKGPIRIYFSLEEHGPGRRSSTMGLSKALWQYYTVSGWKPLETVDNTRNLTRSGGLEFFAPPGFVKKTIFNEELYWLKAAGIMEGTGLQPPPGIKGIHPNTTIAVQVESIEDEILGSSDGRANQEFHLLRKPIVSEETWIDETGTLTFEEKQTIMKESGEDAVREIEDEIDGSLEVRVRWQAVEDFFASTPKSRHYVIERANGRVMFGDGIRGMIPPAGRDNIIVSYNVGGGAKGNVSALEIIDMKTAIPFVDEISNPEPAEGGSDTEQMQDVFKRGPYLIRHRDRAVTREDFERLAAAASPYIARTKCLQIGNKLKIIVIPGENNDKPLPSPVLLKTVEQHLTGRALDPLPPGCLDISGPRYVQVNITVELAPLSMDNAVPLEAEVLKQLKAFLHPLSGGPGKSGWEFGRDLHISDVYALLESIPGVDHTASLLLNGEHRDVRVKPFETLCSGNHKVTMIS